MSIKIGHAVMDENGKISGGAAGDQTGKEVATREWYTTSTPWHTVLRANDSTVAKKIAAAMQQACSNNNIGYDQKQRTTLFAAAKAVNFDLSKITTKCETDCSALVAVCINAAGVSVSKDIYTGNMVSAIAATGKFAKLTDSKYLTSDAYLQIGDILVKNGHTLVVLENGSKAGATSSTTTTNKGIPALVDSKGNAVVLKKGSTQTALVKQLQERLIRHKAYSGKVDGDFAGLTDTGVRAFQTARIKEGRDVGCKYNNNKADGKVGGKTWAILWE